MSRRMDYTLEFDAPAEKIYQDFTSREYWQTLMDAYRFLTPQSEITSFSSGERGTDVAFVQNLPRMYLPPIAGREGHDLRLRRQEAVRVHQCLPVFPAGEVLIDLLRRCVELDGVFHATRHGT